MPSWRVAAAFLLGTFVLFLAALFVVFDNPTVSVSSSDYGTVGPVGDVDCTIAPWDARLNDNRSGPGGEHRAAFSHEVASECYSENTTRFNISASEASQLRSRDAMATREVTTRECQRDPGNPECARKWLGEQRKMRRLELRCAVVGELWGLWRAGSLGRASSVVVKDGSAACESQKPRLSGVCGVRRSQGQ